MTPEQELQVYLQEAAHDTLAFLKACSENLESMAEQAMISSVSQYVDLVKKGLRSRTDENSCVSRMDIVEVQVDAFRKCLLDTESVRDRMNQEDRLN